MVKTRDIWAWPRLCFLSKNHWRVYHTSRLDDRDLHRPWFSFGCCKLESNFALMIRHFQVAIFVCAAACRAFRDTGSKPLLSSKCAGTTNRFVPLHFLKVMIIVLFIALSQNQTELRSLYLQVGTFFCVSYGNLVAECLALAHYNTDTNLCAPPLLQPPWQHHSAPGQGRCETKCSCPGVAAPSHASSSCLWMLSWFLPRRAATARQPALLQDHGDLPCALLSRIVRGMRLGSGTAVV